MSIVYTGRTHWEEISHATSAVASREDPLMLRVALTRRWPEAVEAVLADEFTLSVNESDLPLDKKQLMRLMADSDVLGVTVTDYIDAEVINAPGSRVKLLANFGVGFNHIDLEVARAAGIGVTNTPGVLTDCTADLAMTLMLMAARRAGEGERELRAGQWAGWRPTHLLGTRVTGKTLGIVGAGRIGLATARRAHHGFGMDILLHSRSPVVPEVLEELAAEQLPLDELLDRSDFVSLHCPSNADTFHMIDARRLALLGPSGILINTARGDVIDEAALLDALAGGDIAGAGLDVYEREPEIPPALLECENLVALPHLGSGTVETRGAMGMRAVENIRAFAAGREPPDLL
jgi:lactate dehydrogenase-like 2-hydroxyacid dehydrogenase